MKKAVEKGRRKDTAEILDADFDALAKILMSMDDRDKIEYLKKAINKLQQWDSYGKPPSLLDL